MQKTPQIEWSERDIGQRMSIIIGYSLYVLFSGYVVYEMITGSPYAELAKLSLAFLLGMAANELVQRWRRRNAR